MKLSLVLLFMSPLAFANSSQDKKFTDQKISAIVMEANNADIAVGRMVKSKTKNPNVRSYALEMIDDHSANNHELQQVMEKANIRHLQAEESRNIKEQKKDTKKDLSSLEGPALDQAYADGEVAMHSQVLNTLDQDLIPNAKSPNLREYLSKTREVISHHLEHAKNLQAQLKI